MEVALLVVLLGVQVVMEVLLLVGMGMLQLRRQLSRTV
jgi:hypothetical protein